MPDVKTNRVTAHHKVGMGVLSDILKPDVLHGRVPRLEEVAEARASFKNKMNDIQVLGKFTRATGFVPGRDMQFVAQIDQSVWSAVVEVFGNELYPPGEPVNKRLFYALLNGPLKDFDMRGRVIV